MIAELPGGGRANTILVDVGPGSFTGVRVGIAAARALALGWDARAAGYSSLVLLAASGFARAPVPLGELVAVLEGGHGEVFMQGFTAPPFLVADPLASRPPAEALLAIGDRLAIGDGTRRLLSLAPDRLFESALPDAADAVFLPPEFRALAPRPIYGRAPDARLPTR